MTKTIGILTSGGDCAGLNATIRAVALRAHHGYGWKTIGISHGTLGLLRRPVAAEPLDPAKLDAALARQGGTFLGSTNRGDPFAYPMPNGTLKDRSPEMHEGLRELHLDGLIGVGADVVLLPEVRWQLANVVQRIASLRYAGRTSALVVVAESAGQSDAAPDKADDAPSHAGVGEWLAHRLMAATGAEARATIL